MKPPNSPPGPVREFFLGTWTGRIIIVILFMTVVSGLNQVCSRSEDTHPTAGNSEMPSTESVPNIVTFTSRPTQVPLPNKREWYDGGTLHKATAAEWNRASSRNKLATAADWVAFVRLDQGEIISMGDLRSQSQELMDCVGAFALQVEYDWNIAESAAVCLQFIGN